MRPGGGSYIVNQAAQRVARSRMYAAQTATLQNAYGTALVEEGHAAVSQGHRARPGCLEPARCSAGGSRLESRVRGRGGR